MSDKITREEFDSLFFLEGSGFNPKEIDDVDFHFEENIAMITGSDSVEEYALRKTDDPEEMKVIQAIANVLQDHKNMLQILRNHHHETNRKYHDLIKENVREEIEKNTLCGNNRKFSR